MFYSSSFITISRSVKHSINNRTTSIARYIFQVHCPRKAIVCRVSSLKAVFSSSSFNGVNNLHFLGFQSSVSIQTHWCYNLLGFPQHESQLKLIIELPIIVIEGKSRQCGNTVRQWNCGVF